MRYIYMPTIPRHAVRQSALVRTVRDDKLEQSAITDEAGQYSFPTLPPGMYEVSAHLPGFVGVRFSGIEVRSSQTSRQNMMLSVGGVSSRIEVSVTGQPRGVAAPTTMPRRIRVGGNVRAPNLVSQVKPVYPQWAHDAGVEGVVRLQGVIGVDGSLIALRVVSSSHPGLAAAAQESVRQWKYQPAQLNGESIEVTTEIDVEFKIAQ